MGAEDPFYPLGLWYHTDCSKMGTCHRSEMEGKFCNNDFQREIANSEDSLIKIGIGIFWLSSNTAPLEGKAINHYNLTWNKTENACKCMTAMFEINGNLRDQILSSQNYMNYTTYSVSQDFIEFCRFS